MKEELQIAVNNWYQCWKVSPYCFDNDGDELCFESFLIEAFPEIKFSYNIKTDEWIII